MAIYKQKINYLQDNHNINSAHIWSLLSLLKTQTFPCRRDLFICKGGPNILTLFCSQISYQPSPLPWKVAWTPQCGRNNCLVRHPSGQKKRAHWVSTAGLHISINCQGFPFSKILTLSPCSHLVFILVEKRSPEIEVPKEINL